MSASAPASDERPRIPLRTRAALALTRVRELPGRLFPNAAELSRSFDLMPAPEAFDDGAINPLPDRNPIRDLPYGGVLYATDRAPYFAEREDRLSRIDVSHAAHAASGNGHAYFRSSPWVSSDILMTLAYQLDPAERGLALDPETGVWRFPSDYVARLRKALADRLPTKASVRVVA